MAIIDKRALVIGQKRQQTMQNITKKSEANNKHLIKIRSPEIIVRNQT